VNSYKTSFFLIALFMANQSSAHESLDKCNALEGDLERLSCFDEHFAAIVKEEPLTAAASNWTVVTETSPIDDTKNVFVRLNSE
jgi:hypothetical protein